MEIRRLAAADRPAWSALWAGYLRFYRHHLPEAITELTFSRLIDPADQPHALVALAGDGRMLGFAHYLYHRSTWSAGDQCYLEDLFVDPASRGHGAGRALIEAVAAEAGARGAGLYWLTQEFNAEARALYDTLARRTSFIRYER